MALTGCPISHGNTTIVHLCSTAHSFTSGVKTQMCGSVPSLCLKDVCYENRGTCCKSETLQTANSAAPVSGHRKNETGSVKLTAAHNLLKHFTLQADDKRCKICRTKEHLVSQCQLLQYGKREHVRLLTSDCISLMQQ